MIANHSRLLGEKCKSWYVLHEEDFPPHITAWIAYVPTRNLELISRAAQEVLCDQKSIEVTTTHVKIEDAGYVAIEINITQSMRDLHNTLLAKLNIYREGYLSPKYAETLHTFPKDQQESLRNYGTRMAGSLYAPHITVGISSADSVPAIKQGIAPLLKEMQNVRFNVQDLVFFRQGKPGRSIEKISCYSLK